MNCPQCESTLLVEVYGMSNPVRCASCGNVSMQTNQDSTEASRFAKRSLWLGISSIVLLFLTGIPAIWYGVRSFLQMRFVRCEKKDRKAAAAGIALGVVFGIFATGFVALLGGFFLILMMMLEETKDPQRMQEIMATIGTIDMPEGFEMTESTQVRGQFKVMNWRDGKKASNAQGRARLAYSFPRSPGGNIQITRSREDFKLHWDLEVDIENQQVETLSWQFAGEECDVSKTTQTTDENGVNTIRYQARKESDDKEYGYTLIVSVRDPGSYSEQDVRKIFESYQPKQE